MLNRQKTNCDVSILPINIDTFGIKLINEMECMSNLKIAFFTKVAYKENFRNKKSKQYIKGGLPLIRKKKKQKG